MEYSGKLRRSMFGGFKRKDVLACIEELNSKYTDTMAELEARAKSAEELHAKNSEELSRCRKELDELREQHQASLAQCAEQTEKNGRLLSENESLRAQVSATISVNDTKIKEIGALKEENRQLKFKAESLEIKGKKYDQFTAEFSDILLQSKQQSEQVLADAQTQADDIVRSASQRAEILTAEKKQQMAAMDDQITGFEQEVRQMKQSIEAIAAGARSQLDQLEKLIGRSRITLGSGQEQPEQDGRTAACRRRIFSVSRKSRTGAASGESKPAGQPVPPMSGRSGRSAVPEQDRESMMDNIFEKLRKWFK